MAVRDLAAGVGNPRYLRLSITSLNNSAKVKSRERVTRYQYR